MSRTNATMPQLKALFIFLLLWLPGIAQKDTAWVRTYGGPSIDMARCVKQVHDGGFIIAGMTSSYGLGESSMYLVRTDSSGNKKWSSAIGGINISQAYAVRETPDQGFAVCGYTNCSGYGGYDMYLVKTDSLGKFLWEKTYGGANWDFGYGMELLKDGGFVLCGETFSISNGGSDAFIVRTDKNGDTLWTRHYGGKGNDAAYAITTFRDTNYVVAGQLTSLAGDLDALYLRYGSTGNLISNQTYGGASDDYFKDVVVAKDNGMLMIGSTNSPPTAGNFDFYEVKADSNGTSIWSNIQGGTANDQGFGIRETRLGDLDVVGFSDSYGGLGGRALFMLRLLQSGGWQISGAGASFGGTSDEEGYSLSTTSKGGIVYAGYTSSFGAGLQDMYFVKLANDSIVQNYTLNNHFYTDSLLPQGIQEIFRSHNFDNQGLSVYPNPAHADVYFGIMNKKFDIRNFSISVSDIAGKEVFRKTELHSESFSIPCGGLENGTYFYSLQDEKGQGFKGKLMIIH
jgi:hypothetical protein